MATGKFISYLRVSTDKQGKSGLGLEAQRHAVEKYLNGGRWTLLKEFVEIESGKHDDRVELQKALHHAKLTGAKLVIAKLDRLSRDAHFLLGLQKAGVPFICADMPEANEMVVGMMAIIAQHERKMISQRTKEALQAAKARGVKLGNPNGARALRGLGNAPAIEAWRISTAQRDTTLLPIIEDLKTNGSTTLQAIADGLNERGIATRRGGRWHAATVKKLLDRTTA